MAQDYLPGIEQSKERGPLGAERRAYLDEPIPIPDGQVTTQPSLVARMLEALALEGQERVLEVGTGFGYQTALLARLAAQVLSIERVPELARVAERTHGLGRQLKEGLAAMPQVTVHTPRSDNLSAGIVSFDVEGLSPAAVVRRLRERRIVASVAPYAVPHVRLTPCVYNDPAEIETVLRDVRTLVG